MPLPDSPLHTCPIAFSLQGAREARGGFEGFAAEAGRSGCKVQGDGRKDEVARGLSSFVQGSRLITSTLSAHVGLVMTCPSSLSSIQQHNRHPTTNYTNVVLRIWLTRVEHVELLQMSI